MQILPDILEFFWDKGNIDKNLRKHNVSNKEAEEALKNDRAFIFRDEKHSQAEERFGLFGTTDQGKLLSIVFTVRKKKVRIITARNMSRKERRVYEEKIKIHSQV